MRLAGEPRHDEEQRDDDDQEDDRRAPRVTPARCLAVAQRFFLPPRRWREAGARCVAEDGALDLLAADPRIGDRGRAHW